MGTRPVSRRAAAGILGAVATRMAQAAPVKRPAKSADVCRLAALEMAALIRSKKISARELLDEHLKRIERVNPKVNAIVTLTAERARQDAQRADDLQARGSLMGPLHGLPVAHKDLVETAGVRTTFGSPIFRDNVPKQDALIVERMKRAGAISVGKTNTPEFGAGSQTFNQVFGPTRNPYDLSKTCGGSSGGAAVALACGLVPLADGSDTGGSLRNPAAFCGVTGFRVAPGRVASAAVGNAWSTLSVQGPMARSVEDAAFFLSALAGPDPRCAISIAEPAARFAYRLERGFRGVKVAWFKDLGGLPFDRRILEAVNAQRAVFEAMGCIVEQAEPDFSGAVECFMTLRAWSFAGQYAPLLSKYRAQIKDTVVDEIERGLKLSAADITHANAQHAVLWNRWRTFLDRYEYFILPTTQVPAFDINLPYLTEVNGVRLGSYIDWMRSCWYISITEAPAISVPCGLTPEGLPVGLQIAGRHRGEWSVLQLAHAYQQATVHHKRYPAID